MTPAELERDIKKNLKTALAAIKKADSLVEIACMRSMDVYNVLKFSKNPVTAQGEHVGVLADAAHSVGGDARANLADVAWKLESALKKL